MWFSRIEIFSFLQVTLGTQENMCAGKRTAGALVSDHVGIALVNLHISQIRSYIDSFCFLL